MTFRVVTFGDSVMWGVGLPLESKFAVQAAKAIAAKRRENVIVQMYARTGATMLISDEDRAGMSSKWFESYLDTKKQDWQPVFRDLPFELPTIPDQLKLAMQQPHQAVVWPRTAQVTTNPEEIDLVLLTGGANDVGLRSLIEGSINNKAIEAGLSTAAYITMKETIIQCHRAYPNATIVLCGYYNPLDAEKSDEDDMMVSLIYFAAHGKQDLKNRVLAWVAKALSFKDNRLSGEAVDRLLSTSEFVSSHWNQIVNHAIPGTNAADLAVKGYDWLKEKGLPGYITDFVDVPVDFYKKWTGGGSGGQSKMKFNKIVNRARYFYMRSLYWQSRLVGECASAGIDVHFVSPRFERENVAFASRSFLWDDLARPDKGKSSINDPMADARAEASYAVHGKRNSPDELASFAHPNVGGAGAYTEQIQQRVLGLRSRALRDLLAGGSSLREVIPEPWSTERVSLSGLFHLHEVEILSFEVAWRTEVVSYDVDSVVLLYLPGEKKPRTTFLDPSALRGSAYHTSFSFEIAGKLMRNQLSQCSLTGLRWSQAMVMRPSPEPLTQETRDQWARDRGVRLLRMSINGVHVKTWPFLIPRDMGINRFFLR
ncbi:MAG: hypothetical protein AAFV53_05000 [Myxococcota bacterium]